MMEQASAIADEQVIANILGGDREQFALLIRKYNQRLYRVCRSYLREENEIEDVMQETYIKGFLGLSAFQGRSQFGTWLVRILINESLQRLRSKNRENLLIREGAGHDVAFSDLRTPESISLQKELRSQLEQSVLGLPDIYRTVFVMREIEKMNVADTADCLAISETNVKVRLNRAKELLRKSLTTEFPEGEFLGFHADRCQRVATFVMLRVRI